MHGCIYRSLRCWRSAVLGGWGVGGVGVFHFFSLRPQNRRPLATQARLHITDLTMTSFFYFYYHHHYNYRYYYYYYYYYYYSHYSSLTMHMQRNNYLPLTYYLTRTTEEFGTYITIPFCFIITNLEWV